MESFFRNIIYGNEDKVEKDITKKLLDFFDDMKDEDEFSIMVWILGSTGAGKTSLGYIINQLILEKDTYKVRTKIKDKNGNETYIHRPRHVAFYNVPQTLIDNTKESMLDHGYGEYAERIRNIKHFRELLSNDILFIDEGILSTNAKEALTIKFREFEKGLSYTRHKRICVILNSTDNGILKSFRAKAHIKIYKKLGKEFINLNKDDEFVKKYKHIIRKLDVKESLVVADYKYLDEIGKITLDLKKYCPYYNQKISQNLADQNFDSLYEQTQKRGKLITQYAELALDKFGKDLKGSKMRQVVDQWIELNFPEVYFDLKSDISKIVNRALYFLYEKEKEEKDKKKDEIIEKLKNRDDFYIEIDDALAMLPKISDKDKMIFKLYKQGYSQKQIATRMNLKSQGGISDKIKVVNGAFSNYIGHEYERHYAGILKDRYKDNPNIRVEWYEDNDGEPDIVVYHGNIKIDVYSIKWRDNPASSIDIKQEKFNAEINFCNFMAEKNPDLEINCIFHYFSQIEQIPLEEPIDLENIPEKFQIKNNIELIQCY